MATARLSKRILDGIEPGQTIWDTNLRGFGARRQKDRTSFIVRYRVGKGRSAPQRLYTIGVFGSPWTVGSARGEANRVLARAHLGEDPAADRGREKNALSVNELLDKYLKAAPTMPTRLGRPKAASTLQSDHYRIDALIRPLLGQKLVRNIRRRDIEVFLTKVASGEIPQTKREFKPRGKSNVRGGRGTATRTVGLLGAILEYAVQLGEIDVNPARGVRRFKDGVRKRRLKNHEYEQLGAALALALGEDRLRMSANITLVLALTGWRRGEVLNLKWSELDFDSDTALLESTKTGRSIRPLPPLACDIIKDQPKLLGVSYVFPGRRGAGSIGGYPSHFSEIRKEAKLPGDITPHILRHSYASVASELGFSEAAIAALLGHSATTVTSKYSHVADEFLKGLSQTVATEIMQKMQFPHFAKSIPE